MTKKTFPSNKQIFVLRSRVYFFFLTKMNIFEYGIIQLLFKRFNYLKYSKYKIYRLLLHWYNKNSCRILSGLICQTTSG